MKKIAAKLICLIFILSAPAAAVVRAQSFWVGTYQYGEDGGKNAGGAVIFIHHEITVEKTGGKLSAFISSQGYQTSKALNCTAEAIGNRLKIYFKDYAEDNVYEPFEKGDLLLTLERRRIKGRNVILTYWNKLEPAALEKWKNGRVYFKKDK